MMTTSLLRRKGLPLLVVALFVGWLLPSWARATHLRAGDIQAKTDTTATANPLRIFYKMILYTKISAAADQPTITIFFGDGTNSGLDAIKRVGNGTPVPTSPDTKVNVYYFEHTYNAPGQYLISFIGENRNQEVRNLADPVGQAFYISTRIIIDPVLGVNHSPVLTAPAIDQATTNQVFLHSPAAYDADGDSLAYKLQPSQRANSPSELIRLGLEPKPTTVPGFRYPDTFDASGQQVAYPGATVGAKSYFTQDPRTGLIVWNAPSSQSIGEYNFAFIVEEWRRVEGAPRRLIGTVVRDMQIVVKASTNRRPAVQVPPPLCVVAGTTIVQTITGTDPDNNPVLLFGYGTFAPITFQQTTQGPPLARGTFRWPTECRDVRREPYQFTFKAQDVPGGGETPLIDEQVWQVTVVGPPPQNLQALRQGTSSRVVLTWDKYICPQASQMLIYRKEGSAAFVPDTCQTGIPGRAGLRAHRQRGGEPERVCRRQQRAGAGAGQDLLLPHLRRVPAAQGRREPGLPGSLRDHRRQQRPTHQRDGGPHRRQRPNHGEVDPAERPDGFRGAVGVPPVPGAGAGRGRRRAGLPAGVHHE